VIELASSRCNIASPVTLIFCSIGPYLDAEAMSYVSANFQLTFKDRSIREYDLFPEFQTFFLKKQLCMN
jgi:hypothetical protein